MFSGSVKCSYDRWYKVTLEQLKKWNVKYHELHLGKPCNDFYIDDKALKDTDFLNDGQVCWVATHLLHQS